MSNGSLLVWGKVGKVDPLHLVMPITVEPGKLQMCHDERFLNLWIRDCPFKLDSIKDLPRYVALGHFQPTFDDKSGYDHVHLHPSSSTFLGLQWRGWFFVYATLPLGWKASAFLYQTIGLAATNPSSVIKDGQKTRFASKLEDIVFLRTHLGEIEPVSSRIFLEEFKTRWFTFRGKSNKEAASASTFGFVVAQAIKQLLKTKRNRQPQLACT